MNHSILANISRTATATGIGDIPSPVSPLDEELGYLNVSLAEHDATIGTLLHKLEPVSLPQPPAPPQDNSKTPPPPMQSRAVTMIREYRERLQRHTDVLRDLIDRQQVR